MRETDHEMVKSVSNFLSVSIKHLHQIPGDNSDEIATHFAENLANLVGDEERELALMVLRQMVQYLQPRRSEKSTSSSSGDPKHNLSKFGAKIGTQRYTVDNMLETGHYTKEQMMEVVHNKGIVSRRINELREKGHKIKRHRKTHRLRAE